MVVCAAINPQVEVTQRDAASAADKRQISASNLTGIIALCRRRLT